MIIGNASKGIFLIKKPVNDYLSCINDIMLYEELLQEPRDYEAVARRGADWIAKLISSNRSRQNSTGFPTRIAGEDVMWWLRNGFAGYLLDSEDHAVDICKTTSLLFVDIIFQMLVIDILIEN